MSTHALHIEGFHRHWTIRTLGPTHTAWTIDSQPEMPQTNPAWEKGYEPVIFPDLTAAYDAYVAADYADDGTHRED